MSGSILINFVSGIELEHFMENGETQKAKYACISTVVINLFILGFYKYYGFLLDNLNAVLPFEIPYTELARPIGILFLYISDDVVCDRCIQRKGRSTA